MLSWMQGTSYIYFQINIVLSKDAEITKMIENKTTDSGEVFYVPMSINPHNLGSKMGTYVLPVFLTLNELRRYYPEPTAFFTIGNKSQ